MFHSLSGRNNKTVHQLLDKLQPEMIQLDPDFIASTPKWESTVEANERKQKEKDRKWARKNITKTRKQGYKGVLVRRYHKYHHMKSLHIRQKRLKEHINLKRRADFKKRKDSAMEKRGNWLIRNAGKKGPKGESGVVSVLNRFGEKTVESERNGNFFKPRWRKKDDKVHF